MIRQEGYELVARVAGKQTWYERCFDDITAVDAAVDFILGIYEEKGYLHSRPGRPGILFDENGELLPLERRAREVKEE